MTATARPHLRLIGPPALHSADRDPLRFRTRKQLALLVVLHLDGRGHGVHRDRLVEFFWPEAGDRRGRHSLAQSLTAIRQMLGEHAVVRDGQYVRLDADLASDLETPWSQTVGSSGPPRPLEDFDHLGGVEFSHWVDGARTRILRTIRLTLLRDIEALRARGELQQVHERAATLYHVDPANETAVHVLAQHAADGGDRVGAVAILEEFLEREDPRLSQQQRSNVRRHLARVRAADRMPPAAAAVAAARPEVFVAREAETRRLQEWWSTLPEVGTRTVLVSGPTGVGKTTLTNRVARFIAADGNFVVRATCQPIAREIPFAALASLIEDLVDDPDLAATDPHWLAEAGRVAPILTSRFPGLPAPAASSGDTVRVALAEAFHQILATIAATGPVLLVLDDAQHLDPATRDVLSLLVRRPRDYPVLLLVLVQTPWHRAAGDAGDEAPLFTWDDELPIGVLADADSRRLALALCDGLERTPQYTDVLDNLVRLSEGVPYFLETLVADWRAHGQASLAEQTLGGRPALEWEPPPPVRAAFARRHARLDPIARQVIEAVALAAHRIGVDQISALLSLPQEEVNRAVLSALRDGDLTADMASVAFRNEIHRSYVYHGINPPRRTYLHSRLATLLIQDVVELPADHSIQAAHHFLRAGAVEEAHRWAATGAEVAMRQGAPKEAERIVRSVIRSTTRHPQDLQLLLCEALNLQARYHDCLHEIERSSHTHLSGHPTATLLAAEAAVRGRIGHPDSIARRIDVAKSTATRAGDKHLVAKALLLAGEFSADNRDWDGLERVFAEIQSKTPPTNTASRQDHLTIAFFTFARGRYVDAQSHLRRTVSIAREKRDFGTLVRALNAWGLVGAATGHLPTATQSFREAFEYARSLGDHAMQSNIASNHGTILADYGMFDESNEWFQRALHAHRQAHGNRYGAALYANLADLSLILGDLEAAEEYVFEAARHDDGRLKQWKEVVKLAEADLLIANGRVEEACAAIEDVERITNQSRDEFKPRSVQGFDSSNLYRHMYFRQLQMGRGELALTSPFFMMDGPMPVSTFAELVAFVEWAAEKLGAPSDQPMTAKQVFVSSGLFGVQQRLMRLNMLSSGAASSSPVRATVGH